MAIIDQTLFLTGAARVRFKHQVKVGDMVICRAEISRQTGNKTIVRVISRVEGSEVFEGVYTVFALEEEGNQ